MLEKQQRSCDIFVEMKSMMKFKVRSTEILFAVTISPLRGFYDCTIFVFYKDFAANAAYNS